MPFFQKKPDVIEARQHHHTGGQPMTNEEDHQGRRERLLKALRRVEAMNGSPDIIRSLKEALRSLND